MFALKKPRRSNFRPVAALAAALVFALLGACSKPPAKVEQVRPVRAIVLTADNVAIEAEFSGEVRPRVESRLGFRVGGKITAREVDVGSVVKRGQTLVQLDPQDLKLAQAQAGGALRAAETTFELARAELKRYQELRAKNFVSQAVLDAKASAARAAQANVDSARAAYRGQSNQAGYARLVSDVDGVVTAVDAEVGQVVAPGTPVVRVARAGEMEIVIGLPEDQVDTLRKVANVTVRLWSNPALAIPGKIREISPVADPATRTYPVRVSIPGNAQGVRLGMTALVQFSSASATRQILVPLTALYHDGTRTSVWVVENGAVKLVPVQVSGSAGNDLVLSGGVRPGQTVVTAGVNLLKAGQKVKLMANGAGAGAVRAGEGAQ